MLWLSIGTMVMFFAALTSGYIVRRGEGNWQFIDLPVAFYLSTALILLSSISMNWSVSSAKKVNHQAFLTSIVLTFILGAAFVYCQFSAFADLKARDIHPVGTGNSAAEFLYWISILHLVHVAAGFIVLSIVFIKALRGKYENGNYHGVQLCSIFWHFLDFMWLYLFLFFLFFR